MFGSSSLDCHCSVFRVYDKFNSIFAKGDNFGDCLFSTLDLVGNEVDCKRKELLHRSNSSHLD